MGVREPVRGTDAGHNAKVATPMTLRQRYYLVASVAFVLLGSIIVVRSAVSRVLPVGVLGLVFIALGVVRMREFWRARKS